MEKYRLPVGFAEELVKTVASNKGQRDISVLCNFDKALRNKSVLYVVAVDDIDPEGFCLVIYRHVFIYHMSAGKNRVPNPATGKTALRTVACCMVCAPE